jgi:glycosyltransferase involved in cell wall biosynthesis
MSIQTLNYQAPINPLGYGVVGLNLFLALRAQEIDIKMWPIGRVECHQEHVPFIQEAVSTRHQYDPNAPSLKIWHQHDLAQHVGRGQRIGYPIFELDRFTKDEQGELRAMDELVVCSEWALGVLIEEGIAYDNAQVIPCGVNRQIFHENVGEPDPNWTTFLNIGKWEYRKGHDIIVEAFNKAFEPKDRVRLWMMNHNPFLTEQQTKEWEDLYKSSPMGNRVNFLPRVENHVEVAAVMAEADCGVFPSRAEGWNLELLEMMSMGKQVIATNYSAHTEFCNADNCYLIPVDELEPAYDGVFFGDDTVGSWAALGNSQIDAMVEHMRLVHKNKGPNPNGIQTAKVFSWENAATTVRKKLEFWT